MAAGPSFRPFSYTTAEPFPTKCSLLPFWFGVTVFRSSPHESYSSRYVSQALFLTDLGLWTRPSFGSLAPAVARCFLSSFFFQVSVLFVFFIHCISLPIPVRTSSFFPMVEFSHCFFFPVRFHPLPPPLSPRVPTSRL